MLRRTTLMLLVRPEWRYGSVWRGRGFWELPLGMLQTASQTV